MTTFAYIDVRPILFIPGLILFVVVVFLGRRFTASKGGNGRLLLLSSMFYIGAFIFFLTEYGSFIGNVQTQTYRMTWKTEPPTPETNDEAEVILTFVEFPGHSFGEQLSELAQHLESSGKTIVNVEIEETRDYGRIRGYHLTKVDGLSHWKSLGGFARSTGTRRPSPWD